ncbi:S-adenosyl-L-methionine-dependent methyltransferase [Aspergillus aurantiobrunneus]
MPTNPPKGRLISHFENCPTASHGNAWSDLWDSGDDNLWDRGIPSPALIGLVESYQSTLFCPFQSSTSTTGSPHAPSKEGMRRKKALVPGCGRGYDVIALSLHGFDAYGLEISPTGVSEARRFAEKEIISPQPHNFGERYNRQDTGVANQPGKIQFVEGDFFDSAWVEALDLDRFDLIYDYTFLCALHPSQRGRWAERMAELLKPGGLLVCLEFPMYKHPGLPGPPWGVNGVHWEILAGGGDGGGGMFTRRVYVQPERTYEVGRGTDMISVYERK